MSKFTTFVSNLFHKIAHGFETVFGTEASKNFAHAAEQLLTTAFGQVVMTVVSNTSEQAKTDPAGARSSAISQIAKAAESAGITLADSLKGLLVELGVTKLKGTLSTLSALTTTAPTGTPTPTPEVPPAPAAPAA